MRKPRETSRRLKGNVASTFCSCTTPCNWGRNPVPVNFRSPVAPPVARLPRISTGSLVLIATSNFQSRNGGVGREKSGRPDGGCGAGLPGRPMGIRSIFFRKWLFVIATLPVTVAAANGPMILRSASARAVSVSFRATSTLSAFSCKSRVGSVSLGKLTRPFILNGPPATSPPKRSRVSALSLKVNRALKFRNAGRVTFVKRATFTVMSPAPLRTG